MRLIVNADDFGLSPGINHGVIDAYANGIVRSTTLMVAAPAAPQAVALAKDHPGLGVGVHLVIDTHSPVSPPGTVPSLVDEEGKFRRLDFTSHLDVSLEEVEREWRGQIERLISHGIQPTHLDGHHHFHIHPQLAPVTARLAIEYNLPVRAPAPGWPNKETLTYLKKVKQPDCCLTDFYDTGVCEEYFVNFLGSRSQLRGKTVEIMCHPAYLDDVIATQSSYNVERVRELQVLKSPAVREWVRKNQIDLISFKEL